MYLAVQVKKSSDLLHGFFYQIASMTMRYPLGENANLTSFYILHPSLRALRGEKATSDVETCD